MGDTAEGTSPGLVGPSLGDDELARAQTLGAIVAERAAIHPDREALVFDDPLRSPGTAPETVRWTYADLVHQSRRVARALVAEGVGKGHGVGILMGNRPEAVASVLGASLVGAIAVPLSTFSTEPELAHLLRQADIRVLVLQTTLGRRTFAADVVDLCGAATGAGPVLDPAFPSLRHVAAVGPAHDAHGIAPWDAFLGRGDAIGHELLEAIVAEVHRSDPALVVFSSGTTDQPKGVVHTQGAIARQWATQARLFGRDGDTRVWCPLPIFWTAGLNAALGATLAGGATWVMQERYEPGEALRLIERERVTEPHVFGHQARSLEEHPGWATADLSSCTKVFGKSIFTRHPTVRGDESWNMPVGYGMSETASFFTAMPSTARRDEFRPASFGRLLPGNELRVVDPETGAALGPGERGELLVRGPTLMERYVKRTRAESLDPDGWHRTGDLGSFDEDGHVTFDSRLTDMIKMAGANISPAEIEVQLSAYEPIKLARVVGIPDQRRDEIAVVCVALKDGASTTEADITAFLQDRVASYKVPHHVLFFAEEEIPMNRSGTKVQHDRLVAAVLDRLDRPGPQGRPAPSEESAV